MYENDSFFAQLDTYPTTLTQEMHFYSSFFMEN